MSPQSRMFSLCCRLARVLLLTCIFSFSEQAVAEPSAPVCERAAADAAMRYNVPYDVLMAVTLTETGRKRGGSLKPWPWTVNMEGAGKWFKTRAEAQSFVDRHFARGARSFDVGCFQINYKWHGRSFASIEQMFDPTVNAAYAARFLTELHAEFGDWSKAAGAFHSRTPKYAQRYRARFDRLRAGVNSADIPIVPVVVETTAPVPVRLPNRFPLLRAQGQRMSVGSLVMLQGTAENGRLVSLGNGPGPLLELR